MGEAHGYCFCVWVVVWLMVRQRAWLMSFGAGRNDMLKPHRAVRSFYTSSDNHPTTTESFPAWRRWRNFELIFGDTQPIDEG
jgi:hypothetical protein